MFESPTGRDVVSVLTYRSRLGLVKIGEGLDLGLVSDWKSKVSVLHHKVSFTSRLKYIFDAFCTGFLDTYTKRVQFYQGSIRLNFEGIVLTFY